MCAASWKVALRFDCCWKSSLCPSKCLCSAPLRTLAFDRGVYSQNRHFVRLHVSRATSVEAIMIVTIRHSVNIGTLPGELPKHSTTHFSTNLFVARKQ